MTETAADHVAAGNHRFDAIVIGAGPAGLYELYLLREMGLHVRGLEAGGGVGGTWYWNRYPGARLHSESVSYQYFFSQEVLQEWDWSELFAGQPELERYFNAVAERLELKPCIDFNTRVTSMRFDEASNSWTLGTQAGVTYTASVVVSALGVLSAPIYPSAPGIETFRGEAFHTARWPHRHVDFAGKRVVVVGTGATGVQAIPHIAAEAARLTVMMRNPHWVVPLNNRPLPEAEMEEIRAGYPELHEYLKGTFGGFMHNVDMTPSSAYGENELRELYDDRWAMPGFAKWVGMPYDILSEEPRNAHYGEYIKAKIRERIHDPEVASLLMPTEFFGARPVECETLPFFEVFNQDNVELASVKTEPIVEFTPRGVRTSAREIEADIIVFATGFEAFTGALDRVDITGIGGRTLRDEWAAGPATLLGIAVAGFPNMFMIGGPHGKGGHGNSPRCAEYPLQWIAELTQRIVRGDTARVEADAQAQAEWTAGVVAAGEASVVARAASSYLFGDNVEGKRRGYIAYLGSLPDFVAKLEACATNGYPGFTLTAKPAGASTSMP